MGTIVVTTVPRPTCDINGFLRDICTPEKAKVLNQNATAATCANDKFENKVLTTSTWVFSCDGSKAQVITNNTELRTDPLLNGEGCEHRIKNWRNGQETVHPG